MMAPIIDETIDGEENKEYFSNRKFISPHDRYQTLVENTHDYWNKTKQLQKTQIPNTKARDSNENHRALKPTLEMVSFFLPL